ncbi:MAG: hypothetical protein FJY97_00440 [candidate division Zixibacteria bacterium]|nr:hypothetical protein [candidate division Zixibacteria bacterium]
MREISAQLAQSQGLARTVSGRFDWTASLFAERSTFDAPAPLGYALGVVERTRERYGFDLRRSLRNGLRVGASVNLIHAGFSPGFLTPVDLADARLSVSIPLLRGRGTGYADAEERVARIDLQGAEMMRTRLLSEGIA